MVGILILFGILIIIIFTILIVVIFLQSRKLKELDLKEKGTEQSKSNNGWFRAGMLVAVLAICTPFFIMILSKTKFSVDQINELGTIGDFYGGTTVGLLSLASILFVIHTIGVQGHELKLNREELELTRKEFKAGNTTAKVQQIDNAFFNMLSLHHEFVNSMKVKNRGNLISGREVFSVLNYQFGGIYTEKIFLLEDEEPTDIKWQRKGVQDKYLKRVFGHKGTITQEILDESYKIFHFNYGNVFGHYMRFTYRIVKFIVENVAQDETEQQELEKATGREVIIADKRYYFGMLRAQWSKAEFELILINALYSDNHKFKDLILKYDVLDIGATENNSEYFKLKESAKIYQPYKNLIEVKK